MLMEKVVMSYMVALTAVDKPADPALGGMTKDRNGYDVVSEEDAEDDAILQLLIDNEEGNTNSLW